MLAISLWFLLYYSGVPSWVWILFGVAILIAILGVFIKEVFLKQTITSSGKDVTSEYYTFWSVLYIILHLMAFVLIIAGIVFVIQYSTVPWWVWVILAVAIASSIISTMIMGLSGGSSVGMIFGVIFYIAALVLFIIGIILLIIHSNAPWWVWLIVGLTILFGVMS